MGGMTARGVTGTGPALWARMSLVVALLVVPLLLLALHLVGERRRAELAEVEDRALSIARALALHPLQSVRQAKAQLERLAAASGEAQGPDCEAWLSGQLALHPLFYDLAIVDAAGNMACTAVPNKGRINVADREYFRRALSQQEFQLSGLIRGRASDRWMLVAAQPTQTGVLLAALDLGGFQELVSALPLDEGFLISIVDRTGRLLARSPQDANLLGREIPEAARFREQLPGRGEGFGGVLAIDEVPRAVAYAPVADTGLFLRVGLPLTEVDRAAAEVLLKSLLAIGLVLALALAVGWTTFRSLIAQPLGALHRAAARLGGGDLGARTGIRADAPLVGRLAEKLDELAAHGQRVTRALRTLSAGNRTLLRERSERELLGAMCRVAVEHGGYAAAYACYARHDEAKSIDVMALAGADHGFLGSARLTWDETGSGQGSIGRCLRSGRSVVLRSIATDPGTGPWRAAANAHGFASIISLPLRVNGALIGTFTLAAREEDAFDADEVALLDEMAADLSFGIEVIRGDARRREAEEIARRALSVDAVVDLPSRVAFMRRLRECVERGARSPGGCVRSRAWSRTSGGCRWTTSAWSCAGRTPRTRRAAPGGFARRSKGRCASATRSSTCSSPSA
jgi:hypothetical protein